MIFTLQTALLILILRSCEIKNNKLHCLACIDACYVFLVRNRLDKDLEDLESVDFHFKVIDYEFYKMSMGWNKIM